MKREARKLYNDLVNEKLAYFDMSNVLRYKCGTPSCILGHILDRMGRLDDYRLEEENCAGPRSEYVSTQAAYAWLGLDHSIGNKLCFPGCGAFVSVNEVWDADGKNAHYAASQQDAAEALKRACKLAGQKV